MNELKIKKEKSYTYKWPVNHLQHQWLKEKKNKLKKIKVPAEEWAHKIFRENGFRFSRQAVWGFRIFDFWYHDKGIAIEIDGDTHDKDYDEFRDKKNYEISGILVLRVNNYDESRLMEVIEIIKNEIAWNERRLSLGLKPIKNRKEAEQDTNKITNKKD